MTYSEPTGTGRYEVNSPAVISQTIDGEAVIIDLGSGYYYGLNPSASLVWNLLGEGLSALAIAEALAGSPPSEAKTVVLGLVAELLKEGLIRPRAAGEAPAASSVAFPRPGGAPELGKPALTKYSDMQDLLLLDPIHEVADSGWPQKKPEPEVANRPRSPGANRAKPAKR